MNQQKFIERLEARIEELKNWNVDITDITALYSEFTNRKITRFNYVWRERIRPFLRKYMQKRVKNGTFNRKLFALAIFNNLYGIRQMKEDKCSSFWSEDSEIYKFFASHQYVRRELEYMCIDDIIVLSYELAKTFRK